jgi:hypothetical protein
MMAIMRECLNTPDTLVSTRTPPMDSPRLENEMVMGTSAASKNGWRCVMLICKLTISCVSNSKPPESPHQPATPRQGTDRVGCAPAYSDGKVCESRREKFRVGGRSRGHYPPISLYTVIAPGTYAVGVWDLSIVQGPFSVAPCQTLALRFASLYATEHRSAWTKLHVTTHTA